MHFSDNLTNSKEVISIELCLCVRFGLESMNATVVVTNGLRDVTAKKEEKRTFLATVVSASRIYGIQNAQKIQLL
ncbi:MAG: hypothetical protein ACRD8W_07610 [Nitrososphaeraceae archaeon]